MKKEHLNFKNKKGEKYTTNEGYEIEIIEYFNNTNCTIQFEDGLQIKDRQYDSIIKGRIKNPYHKSVLNIGFVGIGVYSSKTHIKIHNTWNSMLKRCYYERYQEKQPTYKGCSVDECWHNFQNFAKWYEENYKEGFQLDKDILVKGNKIYSPKTCCFVPSVINSVFTFRQNYRGKYPIGVSKSGNKYRAEVNINNKHFSLGIFDTIEEAFYAYKVAKEEYIKELAEKYKNKITKPTYIALINYIVEITD